jgi:hypothetical protein
MCARSSSNCALPRARARRPTESGQSYEERAALLAVAGTILAGFGRVPIPPTYTQDELKAICERHGGWWHLDELVGGFCEYQLGDFP